MKKRREKDEIENSKKEKGKRVLPLIEISGYAT